MSLPVFAQCIEAALPRLPIVRIDRRNDSIRIAQVLFLPHLTQQPQCLPVGGFLRIETNCRAQNLFHRALASRCKRRSARYSYPLAEA